jgi:hypothetical protein
MTSLALFLVGIWFSCLCSNVVAKWSKYHSKLIHAWSLITILFATWNMLSNMLIEQRACILFI